MGLFACLSSDSDVSFFFSCPGPLRHLHSFPTRRSSDLAVELAADHAVGAVTVRNSNHFGMAGFYALQAVAAGMIDRKSTRLNSSHGYISYAVFCLKKKKKPIMDEN